MGASKPEQLLDNLKALEVMPKLTPAVLEKLDKILDNKPASVVRFLHFRLFSSMRCGRTDDDRSASSPEPLRPFAPRRPLASRVSVAPNKLSYILKMCTSAPMN